MEVDLRKPYDELHITGTPSPVTTYQRLVRDRIPDIIESMGNIAIWRELDNDSFERALLDTMMRATQQFSDCGSLEFLSDLLESVEAWLDLKGLTMTDVDRARTEKRKRCGSYDRRLFLEMVAPGQGVNSIPLNDNRC